MKRNYYRKLSGEIITENYQLVNQSRGKCEIYRDTGVSKIYFKRFKKYFDGKAKVFNVITRNFICKYDLC